jgi:hypothetical protein
MARGLICLLFKMWSPSPALLLTLLLPLAAQAQVDESRPFSPGEHLEYSISYGPFRVPGLGQLKVEGPSRLHDQDAVLLTFDIEATVAGQRVAHHARSWLSTTRFASLAYEMNEQSPLGQGARRWEWPGAPAPGGSKLPLDELSFIYLLRTLSLPEDATLRLDRHYEPARNPVRVRILKRQTMVMSGVAFPTVLVELRVHDPQRFPSAANGEGALRIYFTDDAARIPVRLEVPSPLGPDLVLVLRTLPSTLARKEP